MSNIPPYTRSEEDVAGGSEARLSDLLQAVSIDEQIRTRNKDAKRDSVKDSSNERIPNLKNKSEHQNVQNPFLLKSRTFRMAEVMDHTDPHSAWIVLWDKVYNVSSFLREHPGGEDVILENVGRDVTVTFTDVGHSKDAHKQLDKFFIGYLSEEDRLSRRKRYDTF